MPDPDPLAEAIMAQKLRLFDANTSKLCERLKLPYVPRSDTKGHVFLWAKIGFLLANEQREFQSKPRGRPKKQTSALKDVQTALLFDQIREIIKDLGGEPSDKVIAETLKEEGNCSPPILGARHLWRRLGALTRDTRADSSFG